MKTRHLPWNSAPYVSAVKHHSPPSKPNLFQQKKTALGEVREADHFFPWVDYHVVGLFEAWGALSDLILPWPAFCNIERLELLWANFFCCEALILTLQTRFTQNWYSEARGS